MDEKNLNTDKFMSYHIGNLQGIGSRENQEDSFAFVNALDVKAMKKEGLFFAMCDGMGGMKDGKCASETAVECMKASFKLIEHEKDIAMQLKNAVYLASENVEGLLHGDGGSTLVAGIIYDGKLYFASVGDSFLYLKRGEYLYRINREHTLCNKTHISCIREGNFDPSIGKNTVKGKALTKYLGLKGLDNIDLFIRPFNLRDGDTIIACSDGVGGVLNEAEIWYGLNCETPEEACQFLERQIVSRNNPNQDNYTALVIKCII